MSEELRYDVNGRPYLFVKYDEKGFDHMRPMEKEITSVTMLPNPKEGFTAFVWFSKRWKDVETQKVTNRRYCERVVILGLCLQVINLGAVDRYTVDNWVYRYRQHEELESITTFRKSKAEEEQEEFDALMKREFEPEEDTLMGEAHENRLMADMIEHNNEVCLDCNLPAAICGCEPF